MPNFETNGLSLEDKETAEKRVQQINEGEQQFQPNTEDAAALTKKAEEEAAALTEEAEAKAVEDTAAYDAKLAELQGEREEDAVSGLENPEDTSIENEPLKPELQPYAQKIDAAFSEAAALETKAAELKQSGASFEEWDSLEVKARKLRNSILDGKAGSRGEGPGNFTSMVELPTKRSGELPDAYETRTDAAYAEYQKASHDSPQILLKMAKAGSLKLEDISRRLLMDQKFIQALSQTKWAENDTEFQVAQRDNLFGAYAAKSRY